MSCSDRELRLATNLAYLDLHLAFENMNPENNNQNVRLIDMINIILKREDINLSKDQVELYREVIQELVQTGNKGWIAVEIYNDNKKDESGFYGIVIDTGDGLIVSFRGSEDITDPQHVKQDWVNADLALMNNTLTEQQRVVNEWLKNINESLFNERDQINY